LSEVIKGAASGAVSGAVTGAVDAGTKVADSTSKNKPSTSNKKTKDR